MAEDPHFPSSGAPGISRIHERYGQDVDAEGRGLFMATYEQHRGEHVAAHRDPGRESVLLPAIIWGPYRGR